MQEIVTGDLSYFVIKALFSNQPLPSKRHRGEFDADKSHL